MTVYLGNKPVGVTKIVKKEVAKKKFGATIDNIIGDVDANGVLNRSNIPSFEFVGTGIKTVALSALECAFMSSKTGTVNSINITKLLLPDLENVRVAGCANIATESIYLVEVNLGHLSIVDSSGAFNEAFMGCSILMNTGLDNVTEITGSYAFQRAYSSCSKLQSTALDNLTRISGDYACQEMFNQGSGITSTGLHNLTSISGNYACDSMFDYCKENTDIELEKLESISGTYACQSMFSSNTKLTTARFPMLTTVSTANAMGRNASSGMFAYCTNLTEIHFRADAQAVIESLTAYAYKFGATNATIYFDL